MLAIGCDHGGFELKGHIINHLKEIGVEYKDFGCYDENSVEDEIEFLKNYGYVERSDEE